MNRLPSIAAIAALTVVLGPLSACAQGRSLSDIRNQNENDILRVSGVVGVGEGAGALHVYIVSAAEEQRIRGDLPANLEPELQANGYLLDMIATGVISAQRSIADIRAQYDNDVMAIQGVVGIGTIQHGVSVMIVSASEEARIRAALPSGFVADLQAGGYALRIDATGPIVALRSIADIRAQYDSDIMAIPGVVGVGTIQNGVTIMILSAADEARIRGALPTGFMVDMQTGGYTLRLEATGPIVAQSGPFLPLARGDERVYRRTTAGGGHVGGATSRVTRQSGPWHRLSFLDLGARWVAYHRDRVYVWDGRPVRLFDFTKSVGESWNVDLSGAVGPGIMLVGAQDETVGTPAGTFQGCTRFDYQAPALDAGWGSIWFAPNVGVVKWTEQTIAGSNTWELRSATIGGASYPPAAPLPSGGLDATLTCDRTDYVHRSRQGTTMHVTFTVENNTSLPVELLYSSGATYDVSIVDTRTGQEVYRWSEGRFFTMILRQQTLAPGDTTTVTESIPLLDRNQQRLRGTYEVRMWLPVPGPTIEATTTITVR